MSRKELVNNSLSDLFEDDEVVLKIKNKLPELFQLAEVECLRAGKLGMEIGSVREKILIALLIYKLGEKNVDTNIPITEAETDVLLFGKPISIKTMTGPNLGGIKLIWTVDPQKALEFKNNYHPSMGLLLAQIVWEGKGNLYYFPESAQADVFKSLGKDQYIKLPKEGTNPRGVEISKEALSQLTKHEEARKIEIDWSRNDADCDIYGRWLDLWRI
ncbi:MAG: ThaI family type II restriction endonuclease [Patescibacteria group bacterium]